MITYIVLCFAVSLMGGYLMAFSSACRHWGKRLTGDATDVEMYEAQLAKGASDAQARGYLAGRALADDSRLADAIRPPMINAIMTVFILGVLVLFIAASVLVRWYAGPVGFVVVVVMTIILRNLFPGPLSAFYRDQIIVSLWRRQQAFLVAGEHLKAQALEHFLGRFREWHAEEAPHTRSNLEAFHGPN